MSSNPLRSLSPRSVLPAAAVLLVLGAGAAAHANRPEPFGDRVVPGAADASPVSAQSPSPSEIDFRTGPGVEAYAKATGERLWSYRREGATALHLELVGDDAAVVWDDGMVTAVNTADHSVRWHRSVPGLADWLRADGEPGAEARTEEQRKQLTAQRAAEALHPSADRVNDAFVTVVTPGLLMGFRERDGDLRFNSRPPTGCAFSPQRTAETDDAVLVPRLCPPGSGGGVMVFSLTDHGNFLNTGPDVVMRPLDGHRVSVEDGPVIGSWVYDTALGSREAVCGTGGTPFAAARQACDK
ncbi:MULTISPECIES: hypothetical protein [Kitasatospora]|uniref:Uncharacterized protein n=1 Tax=Kitasatospora setae (strain ATCC 33774 / DSM 43861 / JCM 3304 / KCC A-0304 / NBRC 14216 / KM-6054) TaxID=452652 RepID=E4N0C9_KITSK|nr:MULTISPECIES: hypothetical protein [Kitasatospora]BAJ31457.1 hypothetical protein KSE_56840 [Kitasatospora setae KM-6054]